MGNFTCSTVLEGRPGGLHTQMRARQCVQETGAAGTARWVVASHSSVQTAKYNKEACAQARSTEVGCAASADHRRVRDSQAARYRFRFRLPVDLFSTVSGWSAAGVAGTGGRTHGSCRTARGGAPNLRGIQLASGLGTEPPASAPIMLCTSLFFLPIKKPLYFVTTLPSSILKP